MQCIYIFRSQANDNCLFSTFSIAMCGYTRYVDDLRILSVISLIIKHLNVFSSIDTILAISVSHNALDSNKARGKLVQNEAINKCTSFMWAGFLRVLGLAAICSSSVQC